MANARDALLDGRVTPVWNVNKLVTFVRSNAGARGERVANNVGTGFTTYKMTDSRAMMPEIKKSMEGFAALIVLCSGELAVAMRQLIASYGTPSNASFVTMRIEAAAAFKRTLNAHATSHGMGPLYSHVDSAEDIANCFLSAMTMLPVPPETWNDQTAFRNAEGAFANGGLWPHQRTHLGPGMDPCSDVAAAMASHCHGGPLFKMLPPDVKVTYLRILAFLGGKKSIQLVGRMSSKAAHGTTPAQRNVSQSITHAALDVYLNELENCDDGNLCNIWRHLNRLAQVASFACFALAAMDEAFVVALDHFPEIEIAAELPGIYVATSSEQSPATTPASATLAISQALLENNLPWNFAIPGTVKQSPERAGTLKRSDGLRYLQDRLKQTNSTLLMPKASAAQRHWELWFSGLKDFQSMCPDVPTTWSLPALLGSVPLDDPRIYGWHDHKEAIESQGIEVTMEVFVAHMRKQMLPTNTTRAAAANELLDLKSHVSSLGDCLVLSTRLRTLFKQIYPMATVSSEPEPLTRLAAIREVHRLLSFVHASRKYSPVQKAWSRYTSYDSATMFDAYVDEAVHQNGDSISLCEKYLSAVCEQLERAHKMYQQLEVADSSQTANGKSTLTVAVAAKALKVDKKCLANLVAGLPVKSPGKRKNEGAAGQASKSARTESKPTTQLQEQVLRAMKADGKDLGELPQLAGTGPQVPFETQLQKVLGGACLLCGSSAHRASACSSKDLPAVKPFYKDFGKRMQRTKPSPAK
jgi:hypothetical protein